jgi:hypothetical protein
VFLGRVVLAQRAVIGRCVLGIQLIRELASGSQSNVWCVEKLVAQEATDTNHGAHQQECNGRNLGVTVEVLQVSTRNSGHGVQVEEELLSLGVRCGRDAWSVENRPCCCCKPLFAHRLGNRVIRINTPPAKMTRAGGDVTAIKEKESAPLSANAASCIVCARCCASDTCLACTIP